jgi:hypothetical protein
MNVSAVNFQGVDFARKGRFDSGTPVASDKKMSTAAKGAIGAGAAVAATAVTLGVLSAKGKLGGNTPKILQKVGDWVAKLGGAIKAKAKDVVEFFKTKFAPKAKAATGAVS